MDANVKRTLKSVIATLSALTALGLLCVGIYFLPSAEAARQTSAFQGPDGPLWVLPLLSFLVLAYILYGIFHGHVFSDQDN